MAVQQCPLMMQMEAATPTLNMYKNMQDETFSPYIAYIYRNTFDMFDE